MSTHEIGNGRTITVTNELWDRWTVLTSAERQQWFTSATRDELLDLVWHFDRDTTETFDTDEVADYCVHLARYTEQSDEQLRNSVREYAEQFPVDAE